MPEGSRELAVLVEKVRRCRICVEQPQGVALPHGPRPVLRPSATAKICIVGQAPGTRVHAVGIPFQDPSGKRLREWMGIDKEVFYDQSRIAIVPMGFCFPGQNAKGGDLPPRRECAPAWRTEIFSHMPDLELLLLVGRYGQLWHLGKRAHKTLTATVEHWQDYVRPPGELSILPTPHPSWRNNGWLRKHDWFAGEVVPWLQAQVQRLL